MSNLTDSPRADSDIQPTTAGRPKSLRTGRIAVVAALLAAIVFVCVNIVSAQLLRNARVDLTEQHLYSLSAGTRALLGELKEPVRFRMFMSSGLTRQAPQRPTGRAERRATRRAISRLRTRQPRRQPRRQI